MILIWILIGLTVSNYAEKTKNELSPGGKNALMLLKVLKQKEIEVLQSIEDPEELMQIEMRLFEQEMDRLRISILKLETQLPAEYLERADMRLHKAYSLEQKLKRGAQTTTNKISQNPTRNQPNSVQYNPVKEEPLYKITLLSSPKMNPTAIKVEPIPPPNSTSSLSTTQLIPPNPPPVAIRRVSRSKSRRNERDTIRPRKSSRIMSKPAKGVQRMADVGEHNPVQKILSTTRFQRKSGRKNSEKRAKKQTDNADHNTKIIGKLIDKQTTVVPNTPSTLLNSTIRPPAPTAHPTKKHKSKATKNVAATTTSKSSVKKSSAVTKRPSPIFRSFNNKTTTLSSTKHPVQDQIAEETTASSVVISQLTTMAPPKSFHMATTAETTTSTTLSITTKKLEKSSIEIRSAAVKEEHELVDVDVLDEERIITV